MDSARADYSASPVSVLAHYGMRAPYVLLSDSPVFLQHAARAPEQRAVFRLPIAVVTPEVVRGEHLELLVDEARVEGRPRWRCCSAHRPPQRMGWYGRWKPKSAAATASSSSAAPAARAAAAQLRRLRCHARRPAPQLPTAAPLRQPPPRRRASGTMACA